MPGMSDPTMPGMSDPTMLGMYLPTVLGVPPTVLGVPPTVLGVQWWVSCWVYKGGILLGVQGWYPAHGDVFSWKSGIKSFLSTRSGA